MRATRHKGQTSQQSVGGHSVVSWLMVTPLLLSVTA
jgi:hypothetical protein